MIDLAALRSLGAVDTHGSVVAAADALGFTPSAVSQQVKRLERQTGVALLERVGRGVMLTDDGRHLLDAGGRLLRDLEQVEAGLHRRTGVVAGHLRIAAFSTAMRGLVAGVVRDLLDAHPDLRVSLVEHEPWDTVDLVATGQLELGLFHTWGDVPVDVPDHLVRTAVARDVADVVVHRDHPLASCRSVTPADLVDEGWIATPEGTICRQWLSRMYDGTGRRPRIAHVSMEFDSHLALVRAGLGIALVPRLGRAALDDALVAVPARNPVPTRDVVAVHRRTLDDSPAIRAALASLCDAGG
ncbi:LysR family transcriptional regulator [Nocardioides sp.]|uniref:LysR family transcriptional regulator n=1 Tax=Nocardioides sp. TaxID=35761 RepID=UPI002727786F|nr:LysR family transcriptional regulator [Nocardioides sp.]MDO9456712.1 LysR family transcriptional regulator [Nocardioides sp.]